MQESTASRAALAGGALAAIVASVCCLGPPPPLIRIGVSGAWISNLSVLEPYRPVFIGVTCLHGLGVSANLFESPTTGSLCTRHSLCGSDDQPRLQDYFLVVSALVVLALTFPYFIPFFY